MKRVTGGLITAVLIFLGAQQSYAESGWTPLPEYARKCALIVKARTEPRDGRRLTFRALESWKGEYSPDLFANMAVTTNQCFRAYYNEHGVDVTNGQEIVFFFVADANGTMVEDGVRKLYRHSTSFPIVKGKVVYASTSDWGGREYTVEDFKQTVVEAIKDGEKKAPNIRVEPISGSQ